MLATATFELRISVPRSLTWAAPTRIEFEPGKPKQWDLNTWVRNGFAPGQAVEFGLVRISPELSQAFDVIGDSLRYDGRALELGENYAGEIYLVAASRPAWQEGERAIDDAGREWRLLGRKLDGDGVAGAVLVDEGGPFGHEFLRVPEDGLPWAAWHIHAEGGLVYSLVGDQQLDWYVHDPVTMQPTQANLP